MTTFARLDTPPTAQKNIEDVMREFGCQLRKAREQQGWTIRDVAAAVGCSRPTVENAEAGKMRSRSEKLIAIADLFDLPLPDGVPSTLERRQAGAVKGRLVRDLNRQGASIISAPSKTEQVAPATAPANGKAAEDWKVVPSQRNGLWKTGPTEDDWDGMTEETAMVVHARAKADGFDPGPRPFMPHHATGVFRVSILDPSKRRDRVEVRSFEQYEAWARDIEPTERPVVIAPPPPLPTVPSIVWTPFVPVYRPTDEQPMASVSPGGQVYFNRHAVPAHEQAARASWFTGTIDGRTVVGIRLGATGDYKVDRVSKTGKWSGLSVNGARFLKVLGVRPTAKTYYHVSIDAATGTVWFDPSAPIQ